VISNLNIAFVTHNATLSRNRRIITSLYKKYFVEIIESPIKTKTKLLSINMNSIMRLFSLGIKSMLCSKPMIVDCEAAYFFIHFGKRYILEYPGPLSEEVKWWGNSFVSQMMFLKEKELCKSALSLLVPNELIEQYCQEVLGAERIFVIPNYPPSSFRPTINPITFKKTHNIPFESKIALCTLAGRLREIYGLDLLLESWKIVEDCLENVLLILIGPRPDDKMKLEDLKEYVSSYGIKKVRFTGWVDYKELPNWINIADVCLAPRTPGFPSQYYNDKDSTKISEYAALRKPIVATGYSPSTQYLLTEQTPKAFAEGILKAFDGKVNPAEPHFWEENEEKLFKAVELLLDK
jgi:glycosyltransferase involved in cell wall biosynthesis